MKMIRWFHHTPTVEAKAAYSVNDLAIAAVFYERHLLLPNPGWPGSIYRSSAAGHWTEFPQNQGQKSLKEEVINCFVL